MIDADRLREPAGLADHIQGLCALLEELWRCWQDGDNSVRSQYRIAAGALSASAMLVFDLDGRYDLEWIHEIATQLLDAGERIQIDLDEPLLPQDFPGGVQRASEAACQLRAVTVGPYNGSDLPALGPHRPNRPRRT
jgi:hypothetical protein